LLPVLPPRYTRRKRLKKGGFGYFFDVPTWARERGCSVKNEPLGSDYDLAVQRTERILLPAFDSWLKGGDDANPVGIGVVIGKLEWMFHEYRRTWKQTTAKRLQPLSPGQCRVHENTAFADDLFEKLLYKDVDGEKVERRTTVNHAMKTARGAWNTISRAHPQMFPPKNPFEKMGLQSTSRETPHADFDELAAFRAKALDLGYPSLATGVLIGWEWLQRKAHIFIRFMAEHYRPDSRPNHVYVHQLQNQHGLMGAAVR
jgi:hypothetical protein